LMCEPVTWML